MFEDDEDDGEDEEPTVTFPGRSKAKPAVPRPLAAKQEPKQDAIHNRSLAMIERAERRHRRKAIAAVAVIALLVLVGAAVLLGLTRGCTVKAPAYKNYGTEQFDTQAQAYLKSAAAENENYRLSCVPRPERPAGVQRLPAGRWRCHQRHQLPERFHAVQHGAFLRGCLAGKPDGPDELQPECRVHPVPE